MTNTNPNIKGTRNTDFLVGRVETISKSLDSLNGLIAGYSALTSKQLEAMGNSLNDIKTDMKDVNNSMKEVSTKLDNLEHKVSNQDAKIDIVEKDIVELIIVDKTTAESLAKTKIDFKERIEKCPGTILGKDFDQYKRDMKPVHVISTTNWKFVLGLVLFTAFVVKLWPKIYDFIIIEIWNKVQF